METRLFDIEKLKKFFDILERLSGSIPVDASNYPWKNYKTIYTDNSNHIPSTREVFIHRTINKWLKGKYVILYEQSDLGILYKRYLNITVCHYYNDWSSTGYVGVGLLDYSKPYDSSMFNMGGEKFNFNKCLHLEGEWCENGDQHKQLLKLMQLDIPEKEFVVKAYDFSKYPKRKKKGIDPMDEIETMVTIKARTYSEYYKEKEKFEKKCKETKSRLILSDIIEVKDIK